MYYSVKKKKQTKKLFFRIENIMDIIFTLKKTLRNYFHIKQRNKKNHLLTTSCNDKKLRRFEQSILNISLCKN